MISRRQFLSISGGVFLTPRLSFPREKMLPDFPSILDHILLGCSDLDSGIAFVENLSGVRAAFGGVHPGRGTRNALLSLGELHYLEIIAPDPEQKNLEPSAAEEQGFLQKLPSPRLVAWAAHVNIDSLIFKLHNTEIAFMGPFNGSRQRPDGKVLSWRELALTDDRGGLLPFFIEWNAASVHPSADAPSGCSLQSFALAHPNPEQPSQILQKLGIDVRVEHGSKPQLHARIKSPKGSFELIS
jgi:hypothetical protein